MKLMLDVLQNIHIDVLMEHVNLIRVTVTFYKDVLMKNLIDVEVGNVVLIKTHA
jgi:hypothetical protein